MLHQPHHDGSPLYVCDHAPRPGDRVSVRVRIPRAAGTTGVHVRTAPDGEQAFTDARLVHRDDVEDWWQAELTCHSPVTHYRFLLDGGTTGYAWLNGTGLHLRDVPDAADFRILTYPAPPDWAQRAVVYQVFPDRFARGASGEPAGDPGGPLPDLPDWAHPAAWDDPVDLSRERGSSQVYGGTLDGVTEHLDHLVDLGVTVLYLTPFFPARSNHRYDASTFEEVDPLLGGSAALRRLQDAAHGRGIRVLGDITTNHTGEAHEWFRAARGNPDGPYGSWYVRDPQARREWVTWFDVPSLPKLDYRSPALREAMYAGRDSVIRRWLRPGAGLDGWRVDVANMTGRYQDVDLAHEVAREVREAVQQVGAETGTAPLLVAEHVHDHSGDATGDGWHGVMNYSGFTRPLWTWLRHEDFAPKFLGSPVRVPRLGGTAVAETVDEFGAIVAWRSRVTSFTLIGSHDTTRLHTLVGGDRAVALVAAAMLFSLPGIPMVTYGDEIGMPGDFGEAGRRPMPWAARGTDPDLWDEELLAGYRTLVAARRDSPALYAGGLRWVHTGADALVFLREHPEQTVLVHLARAAHDPVTVPAGLVPGVADGTALAGPLPELAADRVTLTADGPLARLWAFRPDVPGWAAPADPGGNRPADLTDDIPQRAAR